jgi:two-component system LytT family sensor kinase
VLAYVGVGKDYYELDEHHAISDMTQRAVLLDQIIINNDLRQYHLSDFHSVIIIPLRENGSVSGTLKIYYRRTHSITSSLREMAVGLSQLISTQMEVSRIEQLKEMTRKAEFTALQSKINPHFLFNALNAISSLIRIRPQQARQLIANLADYLRYNLNKGDTLIDIQEELQQVRDYVAIEQPASATSWRWCSRWTTCTSRCRACCCSRWWKTPSCTASSPAARRVGSPSR